MGLPRGAIKIYDTIVEIKAIKGKGSNWPGEHFVHKFSRRSKAAIYGLPDGSLLIKSQVGKRLHKAFSYDESEI